MKHKAITFSLVHTIANFVHDEALSVRDDTRWAELSIRYGLDSLDEIELIMAIEDDFNVVIEDDELPKLVTIADWVAHIAKLKEQ